MKIDVSSIYMMIWWCRRPPTHEDSKVWEWTKIKCRNNHSYRTYSYCNAMYVLLETRIDGQCSLRCFIEWRTQTHAHRACLLCCELRGFFVKRKKVNGSRSRSGNSLRRRCRDSGFQTHTHRLRAKTNVIAVTGRACQVSISARHRIHSEYIISKLMM